MAEEIRNNEQEQEEKVEKIDLGASLRKEHKEKKPVNRKVLFLVAVLVIAAIAALAVVLPKVITPKQEENLVVDLSVNLVDYEPEEVAKLTVDSGDTHFTVTREETETGSTFYMDLFDDASVSQGMCSSAIIQAATLTADQLVEADAADVAMYGLDTPSATLTVDYTDGTSVVLEMGDTLAVTGQVYCRLQGDDDVYILRKYLHQLYGGSILRYRDLGLPELSTDHKQTRSIIIRQAGEEQVRFMPQEESASTAYAWKMTEPDELWLDTTEVSELIEAVASVQLYDYQGRHTDLAQFGLEEPRIEVIVSDVNGGKRTIRFGDPAPEGDRTYCTVDDSGDVFTVYQTYTEEFEDFRVSEYLDAFTNIVSIEYVDEMEVSDGTNTHHLSITRQEQYEEDGSLKKLANGAPNYLETFYVDGKEVQEKAFKTFYQTVISVTISNIADPALVDETQAPVLRVKYILNNGQDPIEVEYLPYDINNYCVRRDGAIKLICKREKVDPIMPTMQSLLNGKLDVEE